MTATPSPSPLQTVESHHRAWTSGDVDRAMTWVAEDVGCHAPGGGLAGKDVYRAFLAGFATRLTGVVEVDRFADGDRVALFNRPQTAVTATALAAECFTLRDGMIAEIQLVFDRLSSYAPPSAQDAPG